MNALAKLSLLLVIILVSLSAYLRLAHSGIGCADWPECYGRIGSPPAAVVESVPPEDAYSRLLEERNQPMAWATPAHRLVASVLGLAVVGLVFLSLKNRRQRLLSLVLLGLTVFLAVLGLRSGSLHNPAVVMGNLSGGFLMLALLGWMVFSAAKPTAGSRATRLTAVVAIALLGLQILLGGLTSANFAATSCRTLPDCHGSWLPGSALTTAIDLRREHEVTASGQAVGGEERLAIHKAHRLGALAALLAALAAAWIAYRTAPELRNAAVMVGLLVLTEFGIGLGAVVTDLPIGLAVAHNWFAGLLLLALIRMLALSREAARTS